MAGPVVELYSAAANTTLRCNEPGTAYNGTEFQVQTVTGWLSANSRVQTRPRMAADGVVVTSAFKGERRITIRGTAFADASSNLWDGIRSLESALDMTTADGKIRIVESNGNSTRHAVVRGVGQPNLTVTGPRTMSWTATFLAPSPDLSTGP